MIRNLLIILFLCSHFFVAKAQIDFANYQAIETGSWPEVVCISDINNDGLNDVVLGTSFYFDAPNDYKLFVYIQNQTGGLKTPIKYAYSTSSRISAIDIDDVNNDGRNDVIIAYGDSIGIFFQNSFGTLNTIQKRFTGIGADGVKCGDLNNDGLKDIAVSHWNEDKIRIFYQTISGFTSLTFSKPNGGYDEIDVGDINNDGLTDVVFMAGQLLGGIHVYTQNTSGGLNPYTSYFPQEPVWKSLNGIAIGDLNNDGKNDVVASMGGNTPNAYIDIWHQNGQTNLLEDCIQKSAYDVPESIEIADLNCDGKNEVILVHGGWNKLSVYEQDENDNYGSYKKFSLPYASHYSPYGLSIGDINNDGRKDIALADYNNGLILLINKSNAVNDSKIVSVTSDTTNTDTYVYNPELGTIVSTYNSNNYLITETYSFKINKVESYDRINVDSIIVREGTLCSHHYLDTTIISNEYSIRQSIIDTVDYHLIKDSVLIVNPLEYVINDTNFVVPNVFSPNNDGVNDYFFVATKVLMRSFHCKIYNRWGKVIYEFDDVSKKWDGTHSVDGTYFYVITIEDIQQNLVFRNGIITLFR
ncbi:MAG: FG-GAP-like repeat-containing protein [Bacteroidota bacterium]